MKAGEILGTLKKGTIIYFEHYKNVVREVEKQDKVERELRASAPSSGDYRRVYSYLQDLVKFHSKLFPNAITLAFSLVAIILSVISIIVAIFF